MPRATNSPATRRRHKRTLKAAKGFFGSRRRLFKTAKETVNKAMVYAYHGRKLKKRDFRALWITRINAAVRRHALSYSRFIFGLSQANVELDRRVLADLAIHDPEAFGTVAALAREQLA